jgi:hypothetical protein
MNAMTFQNLYFELEVQNELKLLRRMSVIKKVGMFLYILTLSASNKKIHERFQQYSETLSRYCNEFLKAMCLLVVEIIKLVDPKFLTTPREITMNPRYMPHFKKTLNIISD